MRALLLVGVVLAGVPPVASVPAHRTPAHFQLVLAPAGNGYSATCTVGCAWKTLTFVCGQDCHALIDDSGVTSTASTGAEGAKFAFRFHRTRSGWELESLGGTAWHSVAWRCGMLSSCSAQVDEMGVQGAAI